MKLDPVGRWRSNPSNVAHWRSVVDTDEFRAALGAALLELQEQNCRRADGAALTMGCNMLAQRLCDMHEPPQPVKRPSYDVPHPEAGT